MDNRIMAAIGIVMVFILVAGLAWCVRGLVEDRREQRRAAHAEATVNYEELQRAAEVAEMLEICRETAV